MGVLFRTLAQSHPAGHPPGGPGEPILKLRHRHQWDVLFTRLKRQEAFSLVNESTQLQAGDLVSAIGTLDHLNQLAGHLGEFCEERLDLQRSELDYRRAGSFKSHFGTEV